jgi:hypothetical protein
MFSPKYPNYINYYIFIWPLLLFFLGGGEKHIWAKKIMMKKTFIKIWN